MQQLSRQTFAAIADLMQETCGLSFPANKLPLISSRLASRVQKLGLDSYQDYLELIAGRDEQGELQVAVDLLTTNETYFFREPEHFSLLERELPQLGNKPISVWSAACSFGDEACSTAMVLADLQQQGRVGNDWSIVGTDISDRVLRSACRAIYPEQRLQKVTAQRRRRYCLRGEGESEGMIQIQPRLRERMSFGRVNLCQDLEPFGLFDVVFLRNVLIYFDAATKSRVVDRVLTLLRPNGLFFIGTAEGRVPCATRLQTLVPGAFRKLAD